MIIENDNRNFWPGRGQKFKKLARTDPGRGRKLNFWPGQNTGPGHSVRPVSLHC